MSPIHADAQSFSPDDAEVMEPAGLFRWIVRLRWLFFALIGLMLLASFNGQWRIGRDSSLYRIVGHNLATGQGYTYRGEPERHIYPGLPMMFAAIEKVLGPQDALRPVASLVIMTLLAGITLVVVYKLIGQYYPQWVAVCVTTGVGLNTKFLEHSQELMTDMPFLLGACLTLLGVARLSRMPRGRKLAWAITLTAIGGILAIVMRPTFWALALAFAGACGVGIIRSPRRLWYGLGITVLALVMAGWFMLDPRLSRNLLNGKYEASAIHKLKELVNPPKQVKPTQVFTTEMEESSGKPNRLTWDGRIRQAFDKHLAEAIFGFALVKRGGLLLAGVLAIASIRLMYKKSAFWGLYVLITLVMTLIVGSVSRYYLMILPLLLMEWALLVQWAAYRVRHRRWAAEIIMLLGLGLATVFNVGQSISFILEQHGLTNRLEQKTFAQVYRGGKMQPLVEMADLIRQRVRADKRLLGPEPRILTFLSGRAVFHPAEFLSEVETKWKAELAKQNLSHCIYGPRFESQKRMKELLNKRYIVTPPRYEIKRNGMVLARMLLPPSRKPKPAVAPGVKPPTKPATRPTTRPTTRPARQPTAR